MKLLETEEGKDRDEAQERKEQWKRVERLVAMERFRDKVMLILNQLRT